MKKSSTSVSKPVMGRVDVLFRFLQLIGKDRPRELDQYLEDLKEDTEDRPIVDRIVDRIIAGDRQLYEQYLQVRREIGSRHPYASAEDSELEISQEQALGIFLTKWIALERAIKTFLEQPPVQVRTFALPTREILRQLTWIPEETQREIARIRELRNNILHGLDYPDETQLMEASQSIERVLADIQNNIPENLREVFQQHLA